MNDDFFVVHDCIHWYTGLGVSIPEERVIGEIQKHFLTGKCDQTAASHILSLMRQGVYGELRAAFIEAKEQFSSKPSI